MSCGHGVVGDAQAKRLVTAALRTEVRQVKRQALTQSGNSVYFAELADGSQVVARFSGKPRTFAYTRHNLRALLGLGLPVQRVACNGTWGTANSFIILSWMRGRDLLYELPMWSAEQMTRLAEQIVDLQQRVGTLPRGVGYGWGAVAGIAHHRQWSDIFGAPATAPQQSITPLDQVRRRLRDIRRSLEPYFAQVEPICFLDDLTLKNVLVENGELVGIIDVDAVCFGDPLMSVGATVAHIAADLGDAGRFYGEELVRCWGAMGKQLQAIDFYAALWLVGFADLAQTGGDAERAGRLIAAADATLNAAEMKAGG